MKQNLVFGNGNSERSIVVSNFVLELCMALVKCIPVFSERWIDCTSG